MNKIFSAIVVEGQKLGRRLGYPTVNFKNLEPEANFSDGVYLARINIQNEFFDGIFYKGPKFINGITFSAMEMHIFGFSKNIYGSKIVLRIKKFIRNPIRFETKEKMVNQIRHDCSIALKMLDKLPKKNTL